MATGLYDDFEGVQLETTGPQPCVPNYFAETNSSPETDTTEESKSSTMQNQTVELQE